MRVEGRSRASCTLPRRVALCPERASLESCEERRVEFSGSDFCDTPQVVVHVPERTASGPIDAGVTWVITVEIVYGFLHASASKSLLTTALANVARIGLRKRRVSSYLRAILLLEQGEQQ